MNRKQKVNVVKAGLGGYTASSLVAWIKAGGMQLVNDQGAYVIKIHKTLGVIDVLRMEGHLQRLDVFGGDWYLFVVGMFSGVAAGAVMYGIEKYKAWLQGDSPKKDRPAYKNGVKIKRPSPK